MYGNAMSNLMHTKNELTSKPIYLNNKALITTEIIFLLGTFIEAVSG